MATSERVREEMEHQAEQLGIENVAQLSDEELRSEIDAKSQEGQTPADSEEDAPADQPEE